MYAYEEVVKETRNVMFRADFNFRWLKEVPQINIQDFPPYSAPIYRLQISIKYVKILGTLIFLAIGLALYSLRRIRIMRAIGTLRNNENFRVVLKRVNSLTLDYKEEKMNTVGGATSSADGTLHLGQESFDETDEDDTKYEKQKKKPIRLLGEHNK